MKTNKEKLSEVLEKRGYKNEDLINEIEQIYSKQQLPIHVVSFSRAQEYAEFVVMCEREGRPLLLIQDYLKHY